MGRATRWLRSLWGGKKESRNQKLNSNSGEGGDEGKDKNRRSFKGERYSGDSSVDVAAVPSSNTAAWRRSLYTESEREQSKHAIAVAAATAAAADAAVAAAQAAEAVVRMTSKGRVFIFSGAGGLELWAAVKIQTVFRGFLAKKALRALRALVRLQSLVRGYLVRKQAAATLYSMQALIRAQTNIRTQRSRNHPPRDPARSLPEIRPRRSLERFDETRSENTASFHSSSRRISGSIDPSTSVSDESPKIVEIDPGRPKSTRNRRPEPDAVDDLAVNPARIFIPDCRSFHDCDWGLTGDECRFSTAQSTPRFMNSVGPTPATPTTPAKSVCLGEGGVYYRRYHNLSNNPNYMAQTESFNAKVRSVSAPKQRPEAAAAAKKKLTLNEMMEARSSLSGVRMQRSCWQAQENVSFRNSVVADGRLDRSREFGKEVEMDYYSEGRW